MFKKISSFFKGGKKKGSKFEDCEMCKVSPETIKILRGETDKTPSQKGKEVAGL